MGSPETLFAEVEQLLAGFCEADRPAARRQVEALEALAVERPGLAERCYAAQARLYARLEEYEQALIAVEKALLLMPLDANLQLLRGDIYREAAEFTHALHEYTRIISDRPDSVTARIRRAEMRHEQGQLSEALTDLNEALRHEPRSFRLIYRRGLVLMDMGQPEPALLDFQTVARLSPEGDLRQKALARMRELGDRV
jgi:tetratricopeptide (TPR) repeat protein